MKEGLCKHRGVERLNKDLNRKKHSLVVLTEFKPATYSLPANKGYYQAVVV